MRKHLDFDEYHKKQLRDPQYAFWYLWAHIWPDGQLDYWHMLKYAFKSVWNAWRERR